jgi:hypothetical protein
MSLLLITIKKKIITIETKDNKGLPIKHNEIVDSGKVVIVRINLTFEFSIKFLDN